MGIGWMRTTRLRRGAIAMVAENDIIRELGGNGCPPRFSLCTGLGGLDEILGGLRPGSLTLVVGHPSMGKTTLALQIAAHVALEQGEKTLYLVFDYGERPLLLRLLSILAGVSTHRARHNRCSPEEVDRLHVKLQEVKAAPFCTGDAFGLTFGESTEIVEAHYDYYDMDSPHQLRLVVFDALRGMAVRGQRPDREQEVGYIAGALHDLARRLDLAIILLTETADYCEEWTPRRPRADDLCHFYSIGRHADTILLIHRPAYFVRDADPTLAQVVVPRCRHGLGGVCELKLDRDGSGFSAWR